MIIQSPRQVEITPFQEALQGGGHLSLPFCFSLVRFYPDYPETFRSYSDGLRQPGQKIKPPYQRQGHTKEKKVKGKLSVKGVYKHPSSRLQTTHHPSPAGSK